MSNRTFLRKTGTALALAMCLNMPVAAQAPDASPDPSPSPPRGVTSSGEDPTRPVRRFDFRQNYQSQPKGVYTTTTTLRLDTVHPLGDGGADDWAIHTRYDLPAGWTDGTGAGRFGMTDTLLQAYAITPAQGRTGFLLGARFEVPTATQKDLGKGKWTAAPALGVVFHVPEISDGTYFGLVAWNTFDFAGAGSRSHINQLTLNPLVHFQLGDDWFVQSQPEITLNHLNGDWFVPLDLMVGTLVSPEWVLSVEYKRSLGGANPSFLQYVEVRTGYFF